METILALKRIQAHVLRYVQQCDEIYQERIKREADALLEIDTAVFPP